MIRNLVILALASAICSLALAQDNAPPQQRVEASAQQGNVIRTITPIFGQLVALSFPKGFVPAFENAKDGKYIQESVRHGESVDKWSQMITITGAKGLAANPSVTPRRFAAGMAADFKRVCPDSYSAASLGDITVDNDNGFASVVSCGTANATGDAYSESMLLIVIEGEQDYYTIQWAERADPSDTPIKLDNVKWTGRLKTLGPIKLCPIVPGESAPYPSCVSLM